MQRGTRAFLESAFLGLIAAVIFLLYLWLLGLCAVIAYYSVIFLLFPFPIDLMLELVGVRNSVRLARITGFLFIVAGAVLFYIIRYGLFERGEANTTGSLTMR